MIDMGGGMRGVYTAGIYDYLLDQKITIDYGIGVSAGAANTVSYTHLDVYKRQVHRSGDDTAGIAGSLPTWVEPPAS